MEDEPNPNRHPGHIICGPRGAPPRRRNEKKKQQYKKKDAARELSGIFDVPPEDENYEDTVRKRYKETAKTSISSNAVYHISAQNARARPPAETGRRLHAFEQQKCVLEAISQTLLNSHPDHIATEVDHSVKNYG